MSTPGPPTERSPGAHNDGTAGRVERRSRGSWWARSRGGAPRDIRETARTKGFTVALACSVLLHGALLGIIARRPGESTGTAGRAALQVAPPNEALFPSEVSHAQDRRPAISTARPVRASQATRSKAVEPGRPRGAAASAAVTRGEGVGPLRPRVGLEAGTGATRPKAVNAPEPAQAATPAESDAIVPVELVAPSSLAVAPLPVHAPPAPAERPSRGLPSHRREPSAAAVADSAATRLPLSPPAGEPEPPTQPAIVPAPVSTPDPPDPLPAATELAPAAPEPGYFSRSGEPWPPERSADRGAGTGLRPRAPKRQSSDTGDTILPDPIAFPALTTGLASQPPAPAPTPGDTGSAAGSPGPVPPPGSSGSPLGVASGPPLVRVDGPRQGLTDRGVESASGKITGGTPARLGLYGPPRVQPSVTIRSPEDGHHLPPDAPPVVVVEGQVEDGQISGVWLYVNERRMLVRVWAGRFRQVVPVFEPFLRMWAEVPSNGVPRERSPTVTVSAAAPTLSMGVLLMDWTQAPAGGDAEVTAIWRARADRPDGVVQRVPLEPLRLPPPAAIPDIFYLRQMKAGVYTIVLRYRALPVAGSARPTLYLAEGGKLRVQELRPVFLTDTGEIVLGRILLPHGILWEHDAWFTGRSESVDTLTKFRLPEGITWTERKSDLR